MNAHATIKNTFLEDFSVQKCLTIILGQKWKCVDRVDLNCPR